MDRESQLAPRAAELRCSVCLKMFDLRHSNHVDASTDPVPVQAQSCHQPQGAEGSLPNSLHQV